MVNGPNPEEIIDISGPEEQTLFWHAKAYLVAGYEAELQGHVDSMWKYYKDIDDDRLLALVGALCIQNSVDALLRGIAPGIDELLKDSDFTFSLRIKVARSLRLLPPRILAGCDLVRAIRNKFAHCLEFLDFDGLGDELLRKLPAYVAEFNRAQRDPKDSRRLFRDLVSFLILALSVYIRQVARLREYVQTPAFREAFKTWAETKNNRAV